MRSRRQAGPKRRRRRASALRRHQLELGSVGYLALLSSELAYQQALASASQARANRFADTAALFQALGGSISPDGTEEAASRAGAVHQ